MEGQSGVTKEVDQFLEDVVEQIQYKPVREEVKQELLAHLEDRKEEYIREGVEEAQSWNKAVHQMGNAVEIGLELNEVRKVQHNKPILISLALLVILGIGGNIREVVLNENSFITSNFFYFLWGVGIFFGVYQVGFVKLVKNVRRVCIMLVVVVVCSNLMWYFRENAFLFHRFRIISISSLFALELLCVPFIIMITYMNKRRKFFSYMLCLITTITILITSLRRLGNYTLSANIIVILSISFTLLYMIATGIFEGSTWKQRLKQIFVWILSLLALCILFVSFCHGDINQVVKETLYPEKVAHEVSDDAYNSILIKELLPQANMIGEISLSKEALTSYYLGDWYFEKASQVSTFRKNYMDNDITLEKILSQNYQNNYRIAYWVLKYGWLPAFIFISLIITVYLLLFYQMTKISHKFGKVVAFACVITLFFQTLLYVIGNVGYQIGWFCNLPFISEGVYSITVNAILAGIACAAYRYDRVVNVNWKKTKKHQTA